MATHPRAHTSWIQHQTESLRLVTCPTRRPSTKEPQSAEMAVCTPMDMRLRQLTFMTSKEVHGPRGHQTHEFHHHIEA